MRKRSEFFLLQHPNYLHGGNSFMEVYGKHPFYCPASGGRQTDLRIILFIQNTVQSSNHFSLLLDYLGEQPALYGEQALLLAVRSPWFARHQERQAHPERNPHHNFKQHASKREDIDNPRVLVFSHNLLIEILLILPLILMNDVVEDLRGHVFRCSHWELWNVLELETGTIIDKFRLR